MIDLLTCENPEKYVRIEKLSEKNKPDSFLVSAKEYSDYIVNKALGYQNSSISTTFLLFDIQNNKVIGFVSLICDMVSSTMEEKKKSQLMNVPFNSFPAVKIAQLAVAEDSWIEEKYLHVGSYLIQFAAVQAHEVNDYSACRFLTVDADIENTPDVDKFYEFNKFTRLSSKKYLFRTKQIAMYKDVYNL
ncbi:MAG: hypothetical protein J5687_05525 [Treponema sp.]|nr:hypothetical protein [Treponema sp.]